jgi:hypothetical protein
MIFPSRSLKLARAGAYPVAQARGLFEVLGLDGAAQLLPQLIQLDPGYRTRRSGTGVFDRTVNPLQ